MIPSLLSRESIDIQAASLSELETALRGLRQIRSAQKRSGKRGIASVMNQNELPKTRVELPLEADFQSAHTLLVKLGIPIKDCEFFHSAKLLGGIRIFVGDTLYDGSLTTLTQKI